VRHSLVNELVEQKVASLLASERSQWEQRFTTEKQNLKKEFISQFNALSEQLQAEKEKLATVVVAAAPTKAPEVDSEEARQERERKAWEAEFRLQGFDPC